MTSDALVSCLEFQFSCLALQLVLPNEDNTAARRVKDPTWTASRGCLERQVNPARLFTSNRQRLDRYGDIISISPQPATPFARSSEICDSFGQTDIPGR
jgi:hypothetical protein